MLTFSATPLAAFKDNPLCSIFVVEGVIYYLPLVIALNV